MKFSRLLPIALIAALSLAWAAGTWAAVVKTDLIAGLGDFEWSADTKWQTIQDGAWPIGVNPSTPDDAVAIGWSRLTMVGAAPGVNFLYRIEPGTGLNGSNSQYFALKNCNNSSRASISQAISVDDTMYSKVHHGDKLTFRLDKVYETGYQMPRGSSVNFDMRLYFCFANGQNPIYWKYFTPSETPISAEVTATVPAGAAYAVMMLDIGTSGPTGSAVPGFHIDGARLYRTSPGKTAYDTEQIPVANTRAAGAATFFDGYRDDPYYIASTCDVVLVNQLDGPLVPRIKYYNPGIKVYMYESPDISDYRDQNGADGFYRSCPIGLASTVANHPDWLYPWPTGWRPPVDNRPPQAKDIHCVFDPTYQLNYYARLGNPNYQQAWASSATNIATGYRVDGLFVDGAVYDIAPGSVVTRTAADMQSWEHSVCPYVRRNGLKVMLNDSTANLSAAPGNIYLDPNWVTDKTNTPARGYENNTADKTPDTFFQEWAFFAHLPVNGVDGNRYDVSYFNTTLNNMDAVANWNKKLTTSTAKSMVVWLSGVDSPSDPLAGLDGWGHFGFCSFLLGMNAYTSFGGGSISQHVTPPDVSAATRLGAAQGARVALKTDNSMWQRNFANGLVIVNASPTGTVTFKLASAVIDETGKSIARQTSLSLKPHTGRIFFNR